MSRVTLGPGIVTDARTADMLKEVRRRVKFTVVVTQGSYHNGSLSAGTHNGGGCIDLSVRTLTQKQILELVHVMREVGFAAWWRRLPEWSSPQHIHAVAVGCKDLDPSAVRQVSSLRRGRNGLANNLLDRHRDMKLPVITWEQYLNRAPVPVSHKASPSDVHAAGSRTIKRGSMGTDVKVLQCFLGAAEDGKFGLFTKRRFRAWQRRAGLLDDAVCGPASWKKILKALGGN